MMALPSPDLRNRLQDCPYEILDYIFELTLSPADGNGRRALNALAGTCHLFHDLTVPRRFKEIKIEDPTHYHSTGGGGYLSKFDAIHRLLDNKPSLGDYYRKLKVNVWKMKQADLDLLLSITSRLQKLRSCYFRATSIEAKDSEIGTNILKQISTMPCLERLTISVMDYSGPLGDQIFEHAWHPSLRTLAINRDTVLEICNMETQGPTKVSQTLPWAKTETDPCALTTACVCVGEQY
jgi:hypothetical protein